LLHEGKKILTIKDIEYEYLNGKPRRALNWNLLVELHNQAIKPINKWIKEEAWMFEKIVMTLLGIGLSVGLFVAFYLMILMIKGIWEG